MNARRRTNENGDLPVGWLDKLVQTGFWGVVGCRACCFMRRSMKREVDACFCYFVKRRCYRTSLTSKLRSKLNVPWRIRMSFAYFLQDATPMR